MRLLYVEIKRILKTKITWMLMGSSFLLAVFMAYVPATFEEAVVTDEEGRETQLSGLDAIHYFQKNSQMFGEVTIEKLEKTVEAYQEVYAAYDSEYGDGIPAVVYYEKLAGYSPFIRGIKEAYANLENGMAPVVRDLDKNLMKEYYERLPLRLASLMDMEQGKYPSAKQTALRKFEDVKRPYAYYYGASGNSMDYETLFLFLLTIFGVVITATVFSSDYQTGAADIHCCTKYGRLRLALVKVAATILITGSMYLICGVIWILVTNSLFGWEGTKTSMQLLFSITALVPYTVGQLQWVNLLGSCAFYLAAISFTLFISARAKDNVWALAAGLFFVFLPVITSMSVPGALGDWISCLLPSGGIGLTNSLLYALCDYTFLHIGAASFWNVDVLLVLAAIKVPVFLALAAGGYCRRYA
ncbi:MAG: ABC transporter permease subunit [Blautia sp.]|nr:ABC transporter permease subunit [Lachnoclostridium sp.]MCM1211413.1 ABC transporter permease subunit [Blautia sp.]